MKGSEIYNSIVTRCLELDMDVYKFSELFHSAILCMAQTPAITELDIYRKYFEREAVRLGIVEDRRRPAPNAEKEQYNEPDAFLEPLSFYLPKGAEILNAHIEVYKNLTTIIPELWVMYGLKAGSCEITVGNCGLIAITTYLMGDIVESVRQLHAKQNNPCKQNP
jgi:hypothetical protein